MSGHNKWTQIKHKKAVTDQRRAILFSKLLRAISVAARQEPNPQFNATLRSAIAKAKEFSVPLENIERAINKSQDAKDVSELLIEAYGPEGVALLIFALTDNKNRTVAEIKKIISDHKGKWAEPGSVMWAFIRTEDASGQAGEWRAKFFQTISPTSQDQLSSLIETLDEHPDVITIYTNAELTTP